VLKLTGLWCSCVQFNISNPATGCQKVLEVEDERKL